MHWGGSSLRGSERCLIESAKSLSKAGYSVVLMRNDPCLDDEVIPWVREIVPFEFPEFMLDGRYVSLPVVAYARAWRSLSSSIRRFKPAAIYVNGGRPCQLTVPLGRLHGIPVLCHLHHPANRRYLYSWLFPWATAAVFTSEYTKSVSKAQVGVSGAVVYAGVDTTRFQPAAVRDPSLRESLGIASDAIVIGQVGALVPHKRPLLLLDAFARVAADHRQAHLVLVGGGVMEAALRSEVDARGLNERVTITGYVEDTLPFFQHVFDIHALASVEEGLGISVIEGAACCLPSVVTDCTGLREVVEPGVTALLFKPDHVDGLEAHLRRLMSDATFRTALGHAGRQRVERLFSIDAYRQGIERAVSSLIGERTTETLAAR
ncbi:glycosyltransferase family 4 protein [Gemmatimonas sp.]|uniref:glycosyltransferase family 4 protein n=1 Tax=Gemmatimonas sp. TaxID=1962908 RepID=UPI00286DA3B6|nr:glycosyltransferase family 4 protein [Gemmatimonas sp.]